MESKLERNWRRVASTHTMQDLLTADKPPDDSGPSAKVIFLGILLILSGTAVIIAGVVCFGAQAMPPFDNPILKAIQEDRYYHLLLPAMVPVTIIAIFINWFSMKLFKHNS